MTFMDSFLSSSTCLPKTYVPCDVVFDDALWYMVVWIKKIEKVLGQTVRQFSTGSGASSANE